MRVPMSIATRCLIVIGLLWFVGVACQPVPPQAKPSTMAQRQIETRGGFGSLPSTGQYRTLAIADLDNDGHLDIVGGASAPVAVTIWYGLGNGAVAPPFSLPFVADVRSVVLGDINGDGFKDIILSAQREASGIMVWRNDGGRRWIQEKSVSESGDYEGLKIADLNKDGNIDIIAANTSRRVESGIQVWYGDGTGNWPIESGPTLTGAYADVAVADFNNDGILDIAGSGWGLSGKLNVWLGDGMGGWLSTPTVATGSFYALDIGDINKDGIDDLLAGTHRRGPRVFTGNGKGNFTEKNMFLRTALGAPITTSKNVKSEDSIWQVKLFDLDNDENEELILSSLDGKGVNVWAQESGGERWLQITGQLAETGTYYDLAITDFDKNGKGELFAASFGEGIKVWRLDGDYSLSEDTRADVQAALLSGEPIAEVEKKQTDENSSYTIVNGIPEYRIGPGDELTVTLWKGLESTKEDVRVTADGTISLAFLDNVRIGGLSITQADKRLTEELAKYYKNPRVNISVKTYNSKFVTLMGAVGRVTGADRRGRYPLKGKMTVIEVISDVGGLEQNANLAAVKITRKTGQTLTVDLFKAMNLGDFSQNIVLDDGDIVFVPRIRKIQNRVFVFGEVTKPGAYPFEGTSSTLFDAISQAGGVTVFADDFQTRVVRGDPANPQILLSDFRALMERGDQTQNLPLVDGDLVFVPRSGWGGINRFVQQISPLIRLILIPGQVARDVYWIDRALNNELTP